MICVKEDDLRPGIQPSSKGNQWKWKQGDYWYKADYLGYESMAEVIVSRLLKKSSVEDFVLYELEEIQYGEQVWKGCRSRNFLGKGESLITLERLHQSFTGISLAHFLAGREIHEKIKYVTEMVIRWTGLAEFGQYLTMLLELDAFFLNEDRHTHNLAVIRDGAGIFRLCPVFDNGAALFSDVRGDYGRECTLEDCFRKIQAKPFSADFDEQMAAAEELYGQQLYLTFGKKDIESAVQVCAGSYEDTLCRRVLDTLYRQHRKYSYFCL